LQKIRKRTREDQREINVLIHKVFAFDFDVFTFHIFHSVLFVGFIAPQGSVMGVRKPPPMLCFARLRRAPLRFALLCCASLCSAALCFAAL
jgi:hypothetical protein